MIKSNRKLLGKFRMGVGQQINKTNMINKSKPLITTMM